MRIGRRYAREGEMEDFLAALVRTNGAIADAARGRADVACAQALPKDLGDWRPSIEFVLGPYRRRQRSRRNLRGRLRPRRRARQWRLLPPRAWARCSPSSPPTPVQLATPVTQIELVALAPGRSSRPTGARFDARAVIVTASTNVLTAGKIKFAPELPKRHLDATARLKLGSHDHVALEFTGNPLGLRRDELMFEKSESNRTAAVLANVAGSTLCVIDVGGKFGRELSDQGEAAMVEFAVGWLAGLYGTDIKGAVKASHATRWNHEPWVLGASSAAAPGAQPSRSADGAAQQPRLPGRRGRARDAVGHRRRRLGIGRARRRRGGAAARRQARVNPYARNTPPVRLPTSATILPATASISSSVSVLSRGWSVTAMAIDFLPGSMPLPS